MGLMNTKATIVITLDKTEHLNSSYHSMSKSEEIKPTDGRKGNQRKKSIPKLSVPERDRSNKPAMNTAKKDRKKQYAKKAIKNVFGSEVNAFESLAKKAEEGSYNHMKLLLDFAYGDEKEGNVTKVQAPIINFFGDSVEGKKIKEKIIDVTPEEDE